MSPPDNDAHLKGSVADALTSWPLVQDSLRAFDVSYQQAQAKLCAHGYPVGPTDRLPYEVVAGALEAEGYERERLRRA